MKTKIFIASILLTASMAAQAQSEQMVEAVSPSKQAELPLQNCPKLVIGETALTFTDNTSTTEFSKAERLVIRMKGSNIPEPELEHVSQLLSDKWSGDAYKAQVISFDSGKDFGDWNESNPNYNVVVATPANDASGKQWFDVDYKLTNSSSSWGEKQAPFSNWCSGYGDIYVRREFIYDGTTPAELYLACGHDDAPSEYYLNGVKVWTVSDGWKDDEFVKLKPSQAALLKPGEKNVLAFHVHQNWGGMYADGGLYTDRSIFGLDAAKAFDIDASSAGLGGNEGSTKLFDEKTSTKWGFSGKQYVIFHPTTTLVANSYAITTANDNEQFPGRNPKSWTVYGANTNDWPDYGSNDWQKIAEVNNDQVMQDKNFTRYQFPLDVRGKSYNYYMWEISSVQGGGFCQVSEFSIESTIATGITDVIIEVQAPAYNLAGQRVTDTTKGIIVKSGKKYIRK